MKNIDTGGITYIEPVPGGTDEWYFGNSRALGDLYEAEEIFRMGRPVRGNTICLIHYPDGTVFRPLPEEAGTYTENPVFADGRICLLNVDFIHETIRIFAFDCESKATGLVAALPLSQVKNCYNLQLHVSPLSLTRQGEEGMFEVIWPERTAFKMDPHESFFLRDGGRLFFSRWYEEGDGQTYRYWEETIVRDLNGNVIETLPGDIRLMPDGEMWYLH